MTFAGVASPFGAPLKSMIVPTTKKMTYNRPPRMVQRATLRGREVATAASMEPPLDAGADARRLRPPFSPCVVSPAPLTLRRGAQGADVYSSRRSSGVRGETHPRVTLGKGLFDLASAAPRFPSSDRVLPGFLAWFAGASLTHGLALVRTTRCASTSKRRARACCLRRSRAIGAWRRCAGCVSPRSSASRTSALRFRGP